MRHKWWQSPLFKVARTTACFIYRALSHGLPQKNPRIFSMSISAAFSYDFLPCSRIILLKTAFTTCCPELVNLFLVSITQISPSPLHRAPHLLGGEGSSSVRPSEGWHRMKSLFGTSIFSVKQCGDVPKAVFSQRSSVLIPWEVHSH